MYLGNIFVTLITSISQIEIGKKNRIRENSYTIEIYPLLCRVQKAPKKTTKTNHNVVLNSSFIRDYVMIA